jgi:hypothetical protein
MERSTHLEHIRPDARRMPAIVDLGGESVVEHG